MGDVEAYRRIRTAIEEFGWLRMKPECEPLNEEIDYVQIRIVSAQLNVRKRQAIR